MELPEHGKPRILGHLLGEGLSAEVEAGDVDHRPVVSLDQGEIGRLVSREERGHGLVVALVQGNGTFGSTWATVQEHSRLPRSPEARARPE
jgi:hypothetical protein